MEETANQSRTKKLEVPFTQIVNGLLNDKELTLAAKGLYSYMTSKPDGWYFSAERISWDTTECSRTIKEILKELTEKGWIERSKQNDGRMVYTLLHEKYGSKQPECKILTVKNPHREESAPISNKEERVIKRESNKEYLLPRTLGNTPLSRLKSVYSLLYRKIHDVEPKIYLNGKDGAVLKSLLRDYNEVQVAAILIEHFELDDYKLRDAAHPLTWVAPRVNRYITDINSEIDFSDSVQMKDYVFKYMKSLPKK